MTKEVMKQVLDALITYRDFIDNAHIIEGQFHWLEGTEDAIKALEEALKQEQDEPGPVAMRYDFDGYGYKYIDSGSGSDWQTRERGAEPLYTAPQTKEWAGLTDEDIFGIFGTYRGDPDCNHDQLLLDARRIEAKIKEKNHVVSGK